MKVISGKYRGHILLGYNLEGTRPTMDRVKESLFAMIQFNIKDKNILDLFSGSGNLGIEALSMGSKKVYFVDNNKKAISCIRNNLNKLQVEADKYLIINKDYQKALLEIKDRNIKLDIIFLDPPYKTNYIKKSIELINDYNILNSDGLIICESDNLEKIIYYENYCQIKSKKYGDKYIVILKRK